MCALKKTSLINHWIYSFQFSEKKNSRAYVIVKTIKNSMKMKAVVMLCFIPYTCTKFDALQK